MSKWDPGGGFTGHKSQHAHGRAGVCLDFLMLSPKLSPSPWAARSPGTCVVRDSFFGTCLQVRVYQFAHDRPQGPLLGQLQAHFQDLPGHLLGGGREGREGACAAGVCAPRAPGIDKGRLPGGGTGVDVAYMCVPGCPDLCMRPLHRRNPEGTAVSWHGSRESEKFQHTGWPSRPLRLGGKI